MSKYTETECRALDEKFEHPEHTVICPRCGEKLQYKKVGNSSEVKCTTDNCLYATIRGL